MSRPETDTLMQLFQQSGLIPLRATREDAGWRLSFLSPEMTWAPPVDWQQCIRPQDLPLVGEMLELAQGEAASPRRFVFQLLRKGEIRWVSALAIQVEGALYALLADTPEHPRAALEPVLDDIPAHLYLTDPHTGDLIFANRLCRRDFAGEDRQLLLERAAQLAQGAPDGETELELPALGKRMQLRHRQVDWPGGRKMLLWSARDVTERRRHESYLRHMAQMDPLTGLPNRFGCSLRLAAALEEAAAAGKTGCLLLLELDDYQLVRQGYGRDYSDALLMEVANWLSNARLPGDSVFRLEDGEFALLLSPQNAGAAQQVLASLAERADLPWTALDKSVSCTVTAGAAVFPDGEMSPRDIFENAQIALGKARGQGRNTAVFYTGPMGGSSPRPAQLEPLLRNSIARDFAGFRVAFQPYVEPERGQILGAEALLRWQLQDGRKIPPAQFIPLAESLGLTAELGRYALEAACRLLGQINEALPQFTMSVNLSPRQLRQQNIVRQVEDILAATGVNPQNLILELAQEPAAGELERVKLLCDAFVGLGMNIALDNFGTGAVALGSLGALPLGIIEMDRSLIAGIHQDRFSHSLIRLVTDFAHSMQKTVCIEGVETRAQLDYCRYAGVDVIQGFFFHKPMGPEALLRLLFPEPEPQE